MRVYMYIVCMYERMYVCMYVCILLNEWSSNRVLVRLGLNTFIGWLQLVQNILSG